MLRSGERPDDASALTHAFIDESGNVRAAMAWFHGQGLAEPGLRLATALDGIREDENGKRERRSWLVRLLQMPDSPVAPRVRAQALLRAASHTTWLGQYEGVRPLLVPEQG